MVSIFTKEKQHILSTKKECFALNLRGWNICFFFSIFLKISGVFSILRNEIKEDFSAILLLIGNSDLVNLTIQDIYPVKFYYVLSFFCLFKYALPRGKEHCFEEEILKNIFYSNRYLIDTLKIFFCYGNKIHVTNVSSSFYLYLPIQKK